MAGRAAHDVLTGAGLVVEYLEFPGDHQITLNEIEKLSQFVNQCFNGFKRQ
jgi:predicted esterase